jgi:hypothetical protein
VRPDPKVIAAARRAARRTNAPPVVQKAGLAATLVESGGRNLNYGDRDSLGPLQQRASTGWRHARQPTLAFQDFDKAALAVLAKHPNIKSGELAQAVQRSAFPGRYSAHDIQSMAQKLLAGGPAGSSPAAVPTTTGGSLSIKGKVTAAHEEPNLTRAFAMALGSGSRHGLPKVGGQGIASKAIQLYRAGLATDTTPTSYSQSTKIVPARVTTSTAPPSTGRGGKGSVRITGANPGRVQRDILAFARKVSGQAGEPPQRRQRRDA